jgi:excisionase family DNA binding protein
MEPRNRFERRHMASNRHEIVLLGYSPQQTADRLNSSKSTVYRLLAAQKLRAIKRGASTLITPESIAEYEASLPPATFGRVLDEPATAA